MMGKTKIVLIGAGSASFGVTTLVDLFAQHKHLCGSHIALCDVNDAKLARISKLAERMNLASGGDMTISSTTDYRRALPGAEFVIVSVEVDRIERWKLDWQIPLKYGIRHVLGENGGPGGLSHALRTIDLVLGIAQDVAELAPNAYLLNYTNPLSRVCLAVTRNTPVKTIGLCHQVNEGYYIVGQILGLTPRAAGYAPPKVTHDLQHKIDLQTAGLNHVAWIQALRDRTSGRDLYPEFKARLRDYDPSYQPLSRRLFETFGLFPSTGDEHVGEYFAFAYETSDLKGYDYNYYAKDAADLDARVDLANTDEHALDNLAHADSAERAGHIIAGIVNDWQSYEVTVNVENNGALPGLPDWAVVEVPGVVTANGVLPLHVPPLPPALTAAMNLQAAIQDRVVEAAVHGDRNAALQALLLDPLVSSYSDAERMLDELLAVHSDFLPRFKGKRR
jgi:alpha-galactosidase